MNSPTPLGDRWSNTRVIVWLISGLVSIGCGSTEPIPPDSRAIRLTVSGTLTLGASSTPVQAAECMFRETEQPVQYDAVREFVLSGTSPSGGSIVVGAAPLTVDGTYLYLQIASSNQSVLILPVLGISDQAGWRKAPPIGAAVINGALIHLGLPGHVQMGASGTLNRSNVAPSQFQADLTVQLEAGMEARLVAALVLSDLADPSGCPM